MKNSRAFLVIAFIPVLLVSACPGRNPLGTPSCKSGTCIKVDFTPAAKMAETCTLTLTVNSEVDDPDLKVYLAISAADVVVEGPPNLVAGNPGWNAPIKSRQPMTLTARMRFPNEGYFQIVGYALANDGRDVFQGLWIHVTAGGVTPNPPPERGPGTPAPAIKVDKTETARPRTVTPIPPPTQPAYP